MGQTGASHSDAVGDVEKKSPEFLACTFTNNKVSAESQFVHDVRTPLHCLINLWKMFQKDSPHDQFDENDKETLRNIDSCLQTLLALSKEKLHIDKFSKHVPNKIPLWEHIQATIVTIQCSGEHINVDTGTQQPPWKITSGDSIWIYQLLTNLVNNARVHNPGEKVSVRIRLNTTQRNEGLGTLEMVVKDQGRGIAKPVIDYLLGKSNMVGGTGFGIQIVRDIVRRMKGKIEYKFSDGSQIIVSVSLRKVSADGIVANQPDQGALSSPSNTTPRRMNSNEQNGIKRKLKSNIDKWLLESNTGKTKSKSNFDSRPKDGNKSLPNFYNLNVLAVDDNSVKFAFFNLIIPNHFYG